jgi:uncharacterized protein (DUF2249 family)
MEQKIIELDVREDLKNKLEPFQKIMEAIKGLTNINDTFILHAPFKPVPLFAVLKAKGFTHEAEEIATKHWKVTFIKNSIMILDNRGLEPPQPMMRTLAALETMGEDEVLTIINDRRPMFLYEQLEELGYQHRTEQQKDGSFIIEIFR